MIPLVKNLRLREIDLDNRQFSFSSLTDNQALTESIKQYGLLQPVTLQSPKKKKKYIIVDGQKRIQSLLSLSKKKVIAQIISHQVAPLDCFLINIHNNLFFRPLNIIEKANILSKLICEFQIKEAEMIKRFLPLLSLNPHRKTLEDYLFLSNLKEVLKSRIIAKDIAIENILPFKRFKRKEQETLLNLSIELNLGVNKGKEIAELVEEIALRDKTSPSVVIQEVIQHKTYPKGCPKERVRFMREKLQQKRNPLSFKLAQVIQAKVKELKIPANIRFSVPASFEGNDLKMECKLNSRQSLEEMIRLLSNLKNRKELKEIFAWLKL